MRTVLIGNTGTGLWFLESSFLKNVDLFIDIGVGLTALAINAAVLYAVYIKARDKRRDIENQKDE